MKKKLSLVVVIVMLAGLLSACMHIEMGIILHDDGTAGIKLLATQNVDMFEEGESQAISFANDLQEIDEGKVSVTDLEYEEDGYTYKGQEVLVEFDDLDTLLRTDGSLNEDDSMTIFETEEGYKRLEINVNPEQETTEEGAPEEGAPEEGEIEESIDMEELDAYKMLGASGGKIIYNIEIEYDVIDSNASKIEGNVYTWDIIQLALTDDNFSDFVIYIEYDDNGLVLESVEEERVLKEASINRVATEKRLVESLGSLGIERENKDFYGQALKDIGILNGTDKGLELEKSLTRVEGAAMYVRLLGAENMVAQFKSENPDYKSPFTDVPVWAEATMNYLYAEGLVNGVSDTLYGSQSDMTEAQYSTLVLRALGYKDGEDFNWSDASKAAVELGLYDSDLVSPNEMLGGEFNRGKMSYISYNALFYVDDEGNELIDNIE